MSGKTPARCLWSRAYLSYRVLSTDLLVAPHQGIFQRNVWLETRIRLDAKLEVLKGNCGVCDEGRCTEMFCSDCGIAMCGDCTANWHNRNKLYKNHSLVPITDADTLKANVADRFSEPRKEEKCSQHAGKWCEFYCVKCNKLSCSACQLTGCCKGHKFAYLPDFVQTTKDKLQCSVQPSEAQPIS